MKPYKEIQAIDPNEYVSDGRQKELIELAELGYPTSCVRLAIREAIWAKTKGKIVQPTKREAEYEAL